MRAAERVALAVFVASCAVAAQAQVKYRNVTAGGELRPGVYGRIEAVNAPPPPLIYAKPVQVDATPAAVAPVLLYVPPGQVRKWAQHCEKWKACGVPVLFVHMENSPSQLGRWKYLRDSLALHRD